jgi:hypothetical protein
MTPAANGLTAEVPPKSEAQVLFVFVVHTCGCLLDRPLPLKIVDITAEQPSKKMKVTIKNLIF